MFASTMLNEHLGYVADSVRLKLIESALARVVRNGDRVADVGCGSGILGLLAIRAGAGFVYEIESGPIIEVARETFMRAGLCNQSAFIRSQSEQVELPERVDVLICDHVGYFGIDYNIVQFFNDAKRRFLKPGGALIPASVTLQLAAVESDRSMQMAIGWQAENVPPEFHWLRRHGTNSKHAVTLERDELLGPPVELANISFYDESPDFLSWNTELTIARDGVFHGLGGWFNCELAQGVWMTNSPLAENTIRRPQVFLPIDEAVAVTVGDKLRVKVMTRSADALIAWEVEFVTSGRRFSHSTWHSQVLTPQEIARSSPTYVPQVSRLGQARMAVLGLCNGTRTAHQIEEAVLREYPGLFPSTFETARFVAQVLSRDTE